MKKIIVLLLCIGGWISVNAQSLQDYKSAYEANPMGLNVNKEYIQVLRKYTPSDKVEIKKVSDTYAMITVFYGLLSGQGYADEMEFSEEFKNVDVDALRKMKLPLSKFRKDQVEFLAAKEKNNVSRMIKYAKRMASYELPENNMCDPVIVGNIFRIAIEAGTLAETKSFLAYLKDMAEKVKDTKMLAQIKSALEDGEGYVMLEEYESNEK